MPYSLNFPAANGGVYVDPITSALYISGPCNYNPEYPCYRQDFLSDYIYENTPYNSLEFSLNNLMSVLVGIRNAEIAQTIPVVLTPVMTTAQRTSISTVFYNTLRTII